MTYGSKSAIAEEPRVPVTCNAPDCTATVHVRERQAESLRAVFRCTGCARYRVTAKYITAPVLGAGGIVGRQGSLTIGFHKGTLLPPEVDPATAARLLADGFVETIEVNA
ncbi:hypothetical protein J2S40_004509 [Nocardioides luteus]|uniref:Uncharacterized protein n=1 Tax=Nocardioides luteus TaxID=1844 RepID=A0ABQ5SRU2_9ACTN|nr:hypothetical protein [Nocardioides luteus]MDR7313451.1 hypothetical protein [Nocardioides luteus]GGR60959.1 hypothetical protein GCM10010197_30150 [Nocardioides luteus]GLJ66516.1 hypothetical protein GCM10017579_05520 [Nocardioides luteus]